MRPKTILDVWDRDYVFVAWKLYLRRLAIAFAFGLLLGFAVGVLVLQSRLDTILARLGP